MTTPPISENDPILSDYQYQTQNQAEPWMRFRTSVVSKLLVLGVVLIGLSVGAALIRGMVVERLERSLQAQAEVSESWGRTQLVAGPTLWLETTVPCGKEPGSTSSSTAEPRSSTCTYHRALLPRSLSWDTTLETEVLRRGLFRALLYEGNLRGRGEFVVPEELENLGSNISDQLAEGFEPEWTTRSLWLGFADLQGLVDIDIVFDERALTISGRPSGSSLDRVVTERLDEPVRAGDRLSFAIEVAIRGSNAFYFVPSAAETEVNVESTWSSPKFTGSLLPSTREVGDGFRANWTTTALRRFGPELSSPWPTGSTSRVFEGAEDHAFGVELIFEAGPYQKVDRALKYAVLLVGMVLATVFLLEALNSVRLHPVQYLLIGCAKLLFYLLLLAVSEHSGFNLAFWVATAGCWLTITGYAHAQLQSRRATSSLASALLVLFTFLFVTLSAERFALLIGTLGLFLVLVLVMYATRKVNWYGEEEGAPQTGEVAGS